MTKYSYISFCALKKIKLINITVIKKTRVAVIELLGVRVYVCVCVCEMSTAFNYWFCYEQI